jgi:hypothetical protein
LAVIGERIFARHAILEGVTMSRTCFSGAVAALVLLAACSSERMTDAAGSRPAHPSQSMNSDHTVSVCHISGSSGGIIEVDGEALPSHKAHGDHVARLEVNPQSGSTNDGVHFARITDAIAEARQIRVGRGELATAVCRITIAVAAGPFTGTFDPTTDGSLEQFPLILDVPRLTLRGALQLVHDPAGRPTGAIESGSTATTLVPNRPLAVTEAMIVVADNPDGEHGDSVIVEGLSFQSGHVGVDALAGGTGVLSLRVENLIVRANLFEPKLTGDADLRASSALVAGNYGNQLGAGCAVCLAGPGEYTVLNNRILEGGNVGVFVAAVTKHMDFSLGTHTGTLVTPYVLPEAATVRATIERNDIQGHSHQMIGVGAGIRIAAAGNMAGSVAQTTEVNVRANILMRNSFGLMVDGGFPPNAKPGSVDVKLSGNTLSNNCQHNLFVAFARHSRSLALTPGAYLQNYRYTLTLGGDTSWADAWFDHPTGFGNTLIVDGDEKLNGSNTDFVAARCS